ncbi:unnamed protein product [Effrenium voratum]|nr:unnamed protein product [Effrenium voratum]
MVGYHSSRAEAVQSVQKTIGELAQMFQKMAVMVTAQEEMVQRIDHDLDDTLDNTKKAQAPAIELYTVPPSLTPPSGNPKKAPLRFWATMALHVDEE